MKDERLNKVRTILEQHDGEKHLITTWYDIINEQLNKREQFKALRSLSMKLRVINNQTNIKITREAISFRTDYNTTITKIFYTIKKMQ